MNKQELRDKFFKECTTETPRENEYKKVNLAPHDMFEWFWNNFAKLNKHDVMPSCIDKAEVGKNGVS